MGSYERFLCLIQARCAATTSAIPSTTSSIMALSSPSPMMRITGSVPDGRTTRRPWPLSLLSASDIANDLRQRFETVADLGDRLVALLDHRKQLQRGDKTVAGGREIRQD